MDAVQRRYLVMPMTEQQLRMAITEPAKAADSRVDEDLTAMLLDEVRTRQGQPGAAGVLPQLSHALDRAWRSRTGQILMCADYENAGGITRSVADSAERAYHGLTMRQQTIAEEVFGRLTATTAAGTHIRAPGHQDGADRRHERGRVGRRGGGARGLRQPVSAYPG